MSNAPLRSKRRLQTSSQIEPDRRKIRKGTLSCWECKRRKVRCNYVSGQTCDNCTRRKTLCISQEFPEQHGKVDNDWQLHDRLVQLEATVHRLVQKVDITDATQDGCQYPASATADVQAGTHALSHDTLASRRKESALVICQDHDQNDYQAGDIPALSTSSLDLWHARELDPSGGKYGNLSFVLINAWPKPDELKAILELPGESSGLLHGTMCAPFSVETQHGKSSLREDLQRPNMASHPVIIARKLLILAVYLQSLSPNSIQTLDELGIDHRAIMSSAVEAVHNCVTFNDALLESVEAVESIMIESTYQSNGGNLRAAWYFTGRAILIAQMMGLHRETGAHPLRFLDAKTHTRVHPEYLWFRLIQTNRYLSLMLGLLQGTPSNSFADPKVLEGCSPTERMQRMNCVAGGYILQRNESGLYENATTQMIDQMLWDSAASLPATWWLIPDFESSAHDETEVLEKTVRVINQITHYHLVSQCHLPNILRPRSDREYDYSKLMAVGASRKVLMRFTSLNGIHSFTSFCRGISFLAFIACTTLCVVHIDARRQRDRSSYNPTDATFWEQLASQHQEDRDVMKLTLSCMQRMAQEGGDRIASRTASVLEHLLLMEADSDLCGKYATILSKEEPERGFGCGGKVSDGGRTLYIHIPYFGTIKFEQGSPFGLVSTGSRSFAN